MNDRKRRQRSGYTIREARWPDDAPAIRTVRRTVFILEQGVPEALEWDGRDAACTQVLALDHRHRPLGTARMQADGRIGRLAVLPDWRKCGIGSALLRTLLALARDRDMQVVYLHAQSRAADFYRGHGFEAIGDEFSEAGIPHLAMKLHIL